MAVLVSVVAVTAMAAATGAATAAGYSLFKYIKNRNKRRKRRRPQETELDFGQELEVYKVIVTRIPPPVAPKPQRSVSQPSLVSERKRSENGDIGRQAIADPGLMARWCPSAVRVLPEPPPLLPRQLKVVGDQNGGSKIAI